MRQYYYKRDNGYIPGPVIQIEAEPHFIVPETVVIDEDGLIVGARRWQGVPGSGTYACSNDEGATWHVIGGLPRCEYQPMISQMADGRFICASHLGADSRYGEFDMHVAVHIFRVEGTLPKPTRIVVSREMNTDKTQYVNAYAATLTDGGQPLAGREVEFRVVDRVSREDYRDLRRPKDVWTKGKAVRAETDSGGRARIDLPEYDSVMDMNISYMAAARFEPAEGQEDVAACRSNVLHAYAMASAKNNPNNYDMYLSGEVLWVAGEVADACPEIEQMVEQFSSKGVEALTRSDAVEPRQASTARSPITDWEIVRTVPFVSLPVL